MPPKTKSKRRVKRRPANEDEVDPELEVVKAIATLSDDSSDINKAPLIAVTFLLPDDDEFKDPWSLELSIGNSARIAKVKELLCEELKLSNPDRFRIQLLSGLFAKDENRINEYVDEKATETTFIVRRDINHRVQLAIEARLKSLSINGVSPREKVAGGTTSSFSDDTAHDSLKRIPSLTQYSGATASSTNTPARTDDVIVAPKLRHSPSTEALGEAAAGVLTNSEGFVGTEDEPKGWIVEFLFPPLFSPFSNLQKKSMRVNPTLPMIDLKTNLVMKCAPPTTSAKEKQKIIQNLELQSITGVVFRDNDTLSENFYLDQHCTLTLVVRQKPEFGFVKRTSDTDLLEEEGEGEEEEEEEEADDDNDNIKDIGSPSKHHHHHHHHGLNGSPSRDRLLRRQTDSPNRQKRKKKADVPKIPLGSDRPIKDKPQRTKSTTLPKSQSAMNPARNILINEEFRRSSAQTSSTYQNASIPEDAGCIAVFALPPSGVFHGLERKRLLVSPFDSVAIIKRKLLHAIRCDVNPDDYELRTLAKRTRAAIHSSPRGRLDELTQALGQPAGTTLAANPGETYMIIEPDNDPSLPQSPRRITGRAFRGHLFRDDEKLSDYFRLDKADVLELELVGRGNTTKPTSVTNVPAKSNKRNKLHHNPTSLASALSLASLNDVLPIDDMLNKKMRAPILVSPRSRHSSHDGKKLKHSDEHKKGVPRRNSRSKKPKKSDNNDDNVDDTVEAVTSAHSENSENPLKTTSMPKISYAGAVQKVIQDRKTCTLIDSGDEKSSESRAKVPPLSLATQPAVPSYRDAIMKAQKKSSGHSDDNIDLRSPRSPRKRLTFGSDPPAAVAAALPANANLGVGKQTKAQKRRNRKSAFL